MPRMKEFSCMRGIFESADVHAAQVFPAAKAETDIRRRKIGESKTDFSSPENGYSFSEGYTQVGEKKKIKAHISKYVRPFLKFLRHIFSHSPRVFPNDGQRRTQIRCIHKYVLS